MGAVTVPFDAVAITLGVALGAVRGVCAALECEVPKQTRPNLVSESESESESERKKERKKERKRERKREGKIHQKKYNFYKKVTFFL